MAVSPHSHRHIHQYFRHGQHVYLIPTNRFTSALDKYGEFTSFHQIGSPVSQTSNELSRVLDMDCGFTSSVQQVHHCLGHGLWVHLICPAGSPLSWAWTVGSPHLSNRFTIVLGMDCGFTSSVQQVHHCLGHGLWVHLICPTGSPLSWAWTVGSPHSVQQVHHCLRYVLRVHLILSDRVTIALDMDCGFTLRLGMEIWL